MSDEVLARYEHGPDASVRAFEAARARLPAARAIVLVEGVSDQIAVETAAEVLGADLDGAVVVPINGAQAIGRVLRELDAGSPHAALVAMCDVRELPFVERARTELADPERLEIVVCDDDLESELIRAAGEQLVLEVLAAGGDAAAFRTMRRQGVWRDRPFDEQAHRFLRAGARRSQRYASALVRALGEGRIPAPLADVVASVT